MGNKTDKNSVKGTVPLSNKELSVKQANGPDMAKVQEALAAAEAKAGMLDLIPTPVMGVDREFKVTYLNKAGAKAVGSTPEACLGQKCFNLFNTGHCNTPDCQVAKAMQQDGVFTKMILWPNCPPGSFLFDIPALL